MLTYRPLFHSFSNLVPVPLYPGIGPTFSIIPVDHAEGGEVRIDGLPSGPFSPLLYMGVFATVWPTWYFAVVSAHIRVTWIVCLDPTNWDFFASALHGTDVALYRIGDIPTLPPVHIIACNDLDCRTFLGHLFDAAATCPLIILDRRYRSAPLGLHYCHRVMKHADCGGLSDGSLKFYFYSRSRPLVSQIQAHDFPTYPTCSVSSVLDRTIVGNRRGIVPKTSKQDLTKSLPVSRVPGAYYSHGLYPLYSGQSQPLVLAPCVYPSTPWSYRRLSPSELAQVFDLPSGCVQRLGPVKLAALLRQLQNPCKLYTVILQHLFYYSASQSSCSSPLRSTHTPPLSGNDVPPTPLQCGPPDKPGGGEPDISSVSVLEDDDARKAVAVKSDDAAVPVHVWRQALERILNIQIPAASYEPGADKLRSKLICLWRRGLFRDFILWAKFRHHRLRDHYWWCTGRYNWGHHSRPHKQDGIVAWDAKAKCYRWNRKGTKRLNVGKRRYKASWKLRHEELGLSRDAARECFEKAAGSTWWKWKLGSRLFFWRWATEYMEEARDGARCWFERHKLPRYRVPQRSPSNPDMFDKIKSKLLDVILKEYMSGGDVISLTSFFDVLKGLDDIRMVYNGTSCGLNDACWAPWFPLPTIDTHLRSVEAGTWMADVDLGEMFLNFLLDLRLRAYAGVDVTLYFPEWLTEEKKTFWVRWTRLLMGFTASPYFATRSLLRARKLILGDRSDQLNPFRWDHAVKNYPGLDSYNPRRALVYKARDDGEIAAELHKYIDDLRCTACGEGDVWDAAMQVAKRINYLGMQNAARKFREGSKRPGAWTGSIVFTTGGEVHVTVSQKRWNKTKDIISGLIGELERNEGTFNLKGLLSDRGFLTYVSQTYPAMVPYLKGLHLTIDSWRPGRDEEGWKVRLESRIKEAMYRDRDPGDGENEEDLAMDEIKEAVEDIVDEKLSEGTIESNPLKPPIEVEAVPRLKDDLAVLSTFFDGDKPLERRVRASSSNFVKFAFGDASGDGYGSAIARLKGNSSLRYGKWGLFFGSEHTSSNYRELKNLVDAIESDYKKGLLDGFELFLFTDNMVAEKAFYKGTSSSKTLFELIRRLRRIEMDGKMILHLIHVSGKRMIASGVDGLSRGDTSEGLAAGMAMQSFVPLHQDVLERSKSVLDWVNLWWPSQAFGDLEPLDIDDWFIWDESRSCCLWTPAPAGAEAAVEEMANWIHHTPERAHVIILPTVWTCKWRKKLGKVCDLVTTLPNLYEFWNHETHFEPLTIGIFLPYLNRPPWRIKHHPIVDEVVRKLRQVREDPTGAYSGTVLCKFLLKTREIRSVDTGFVEFPRIIPVDDDGVELPCKEEEVFGCARPGDGLMTPFQCDLCHFRNIKERNPYPENDRDRRALSMIRRANLDSFWARTSSTVRSNLSDFKQLVKHSKSLWGEVMGLPPKGPFPLEDVFGMSIACSTLSRSLDKGKNAKHIQFNTARRIRATYSNFWNSSLHTLDTGVMQDGQAKLMTTACPVYHFWYTRMMKGMHERMGDLVVQDQAVSRALQEAIMEALELKLVESRDGYDRWVEIGTYVMMMWLGALRGNEAMMASLDGCQEMMDASEADQGGAHGEFGIAVLQGKFKSSTGFTKYLLYLSSKNKSKFTTPFRGWMKRLLRVRRRQGRDGGWLFSKPDGSPLEMSHYEVDILQIIVEIQESGNGIVPRDLDVFDRYGVFRSWRRGATSVARNEKDLSADEIELNNWWRRIEDSRGKHVASNMLANYTDDLLVIDAKLRFSEAL